MRSHSVCLANKTNTYRGQVLLAQALGVASLLDDLANVQRHLVVLQFVGFAIQLGRVFRGYVLFVGAGTDCNSNSSSNNNNNIHDESK